MQTRATLTATEDIDAVLTRFQAWNSTREAKGSGEGVREVSYDEALAAGRLREKKDAPVSIAAVAHEEISAHRFPTDTAAVSASAAASVKKRPARSHGSQKPKTARKKPYAAEVEPAAKAKKAPEARQPEFRTALASSVGVAAATNLTQACAEGERQISMSVRVGPSEQALIRIRAAEAGISVSAYLRQCALDVEILRAQVQQFMAVSARDRLAEFHESAPRVALPARSEGWFSRWQRRIWGSRSTQLSLKA